MTKFLLATATVWRTTIYLFLRKFGEKEGERGGEEERGRRMNVL